MYIWDLRASALNELVSFPNGSYPKDLGHPLARADLAVVLGLDFQPEVTVVVWKSIILSIKGYPHPLVSILGNSNITI